MNEMIMTLREWQNCIKPLNQMIVQASTIDVSDGLTNCSIGMSYGYSLIIKNANESEYILTQIGNHNKLVNCSISLATDKRRRGNCSINRMNILETLKMNDIHNTHIENSIYYHELPNYKFIISPEGNGIDCHRTWEALVLGRIPIIFKHKINTIFDDLPVIIVDDWNKISKQFLEKEFDKIIKNWDTYNFDKLTLKYWARKINQEV